jgi:hypothetical protein
MARVSVGTTRRAASAGRILCCAGACSLALGCSGDAGEPAGRPTSPPTTKTDASGPALTRVLRDAAAGYSLAYPSGWETRGPVIATEFAAAADCRSVEIVDREPGPPAGPGAEVLHSFVQVCAAPLTDGASLDEFIRATYGDPATRFRPTELAGVLAYAAERDEGATYFLQTETHRIQVVTAVVAGPPEGPRRLAEVAAVLDSLSLSS